MGLGVVLFSGGCLGHDSCPPSLVLDPEKPDFWTFSSWWCSSSMFAAICWHTKLKFGSVHQVGWIDRKEEWGWSKSFFLSLMSTNVKCCQPMIDLKRWPKTWQFLGAASSSLLPLLLTGGVWLRCWLQQPALHVEWTGQVVSCCFSWGGQDGPKIHEKLGSKLICILLFDSAMWLQPQWRRSSPDQNMLFYLPKGCLACLLLYPSVAPCSSPQIWLH